MRIVKPLRIRLENASQIGRVGRPILVDDFAEDHHLARLKHIGRRPVERSPIHSEPQIALSLCREAADRRPVKRHVVPTLDQPLLVVVEHVQTAFEVAEQQSHSLDSFLVGQVFETLLLNLIDGSARQALLLGFQVQLLQFAIGKPEKILCSVQSECSLGVLTDAGPLIVGESEASPQWLRPYSAIDSTYASLSKN